MRGLEREKKDKEKSQFVQPAKHTKKKKSQENVIQFFVLFFKE